MIRIEVDSKKLCIRDMRSYRKVCLPSCIIMERKDIGEKKRNKV